MRVSNAKAAEHREQILAAAAKLFRERGFDGISVARVMSEGTMETADQVTKALKRYARMRRRRVSRMQHAAEKQGRIYHMSGPMALARDMTIKALGPRRMLARQNWIYDWRCT